uniref:Undecaprenyl-diphosphatase n=1 Tax=candidate division WOR-3 bacterium TaxID=2052148 RepID=A0A7C4XK06_UNCW3
MIKIIVLGILQGLTEFLPISSSGHLAILEKLWAIKESAALTVALHFGTLLSTLIYFIKPIGEIIKGVVKMKSDSLRYLLYILLGNIPAGLFALVFKERIEESFNDLKLVFIFLGLTGVILLLTRIIKLGNKEVGMKEAFIVGIAQMFSVFPGFSRSGLTISAGLFSNLSPTSAFQFSFLLSLPAILGANILELRKITSFDEPIFLIFGVILSFIFGILSLKLLRKMVQKNFYIFGFYCLLISIIFLIGSV